jgi:sugar phosphate isomerase/epimerase
MKLRLACADFTFPLLPHDQSLRLIAMLGFKGVDIGLFEDRSHIWPSRVLEDAARTGDELRRKAGDLGLEIADVFLQLSPDFRACAINHPDEARRYAAREAFAKTLDYADACHCHHVTVLPGADFDGEAGGAGSLGRSVEELAWRVEQAKRHGIVLGTEAHVGSLAPDPATAERLVTSVPGLTLTLDYTHFTRAGLSDAAVEPLLSHAGHVHVRGARTGRLQSSFKDNTIDYRRVVERMKEVGYQGWIGIEYVWTEWERCNECDNLCETILFRDYLLSLPDGPNNATPAQEVNR